MKEQLNSNQLSEQLLLIVKMGKSSDELVIQLEQLNSEQFQRDLKNDQYKKAFWINIYNAFFQILRKQRKLEKKTIYTSKEIVIAGHTFSLDDIEHGILRKYRYKFSLGYLPNILASRLIKDLAVSVIDYRIHFALNCGAKSCPPIGFYTAKNIDQQLDLASASFLEGETTVDDAKKEIHISSLFKWFLGDFGGTKGIRKILNQHLDIDSKEHRLVYTTYSWDEQLDNYSEEQFA